MRAWPWHSDKGYGFSCGTFHGTGKKGLVPVM